MYICQNFTCSIKNENNNDIHVIPGIWWWCCWSGGEEEWEEWNETVYDRIPVVYSEYAMNA